MQTHRLPCLQSIHICEDLQPVAVRHDLHASMHSSLFLNEVTLGTSLSTFVQRLTACILARFSLPTAQSLPALQLLAQVA